MATATAQKRPSFADFNGGKEPEQFLFEDEQCVVFDETGNKQAPVHFLVVPKTTIPSLIETSVDNELLLGHMLFVAKQVAIERGLERTGYHVMVDEEHQTKSLRSFHVFGRALHHMLWPVGPGCRLELRNSCECGKAPTVPEVSFRAAKPKTPVYISRLHYTTNEEDIVEYVRQKTRYTPRVQLLESHRNVNFKAFVVRVLNCYLPVVMEEDFWPQDVVFRFRRFRGQVPQNCSRVSK